MDRQDVGTFASRGFTPGSHRGQQAEAKTIASQIEAMKARILADGLRLEPELSFVDEGYSGGTLVRPALSDFATRLRLVPSTTLCSLARSSFT